jgi:hypothetical protein
LIQTCEFELTAEAKKDIEDGYLEDCSRDQALQKPQGGGEEIVEAPSTNLKEDEKDKGCGERNKGRQPDGNNLLPNWVGILRVDDVSIRVENGERSVGCRS